MQLMELHANSGDIFVDKVRLYVTVSCWG